MKIMFLNSIINGNEVEERSKLEAASNKLNGIMATLKDKVSLLSMFEVAITLTTFFTLKCFENTVKIKSIIICVQKFVRTSVPSNVYDILYMLRNVTNRSGGRLKTDDIVKYAE